MSTSKEKPVRRVSLLILGDKGIGRTFLLNACKKIKSFKEVKEPLNKIKSLNKVPAKKTRRVNTLVKKIEFERCDIVLELRDLNLDNLLEETEFRQVLSEQVSTCDGVIFVYSVLSHISFNNVFDRWVPYCVPFFGGGVSSVMSTQTSPMKHSLSLASLKKKRFSSRLRSNSKEDDILFPFIIYGNSIDKLNHEEEIEYRKKNKLKVVTRKQASSKCLTHRCLLSVQSSSLSPKNVELLLRDSLDLILRLKGVKVNSSSSQKKTGFVNGLINGRRRVGSNASTVRSQVSTTRKTQPPKASSKMHAEDV